MSSDEQASGLADASPDFDPPAEVPSAPRGALDVLVVTAAAIPIVAFLLHETYSLDVWWQVVVGKGILASGELPHVDVWLVASEGGEYHDAHWLFQILVALAERLGGMAAVQLVSVAFWVPTLTLVYLSTRRWVSAPWAAVLVFVVAMASVERFLPRPEVFTYLGIAAFAYLLEERRYRTWPQRALFGVAMMLWTGGHGLFVLGPFLVGCYWLWALVLRLRGCESDLRELSVLLGVVLAGSLVSPNGLDPWRYAVLMLVQVGGGWAPGLFEEVGELSPTFGAAARSAPAFWFFLALLVGFGVMAGWTAIRNRAALSPRILVVLGLLAAALTGRRNVVLFALVVAPWLAESLSPLSLSRRRLRGPIAIGVALLMVAWAWYPVSGRYYLSMEIPARFGWGVTPSFFPHGLPPFLDRIDFQGDVLNSATIGGFYRYHGRRPLIDGCWVTIEPETLDWLHGSTGDPLAWRQVMKRYELEGILLQHTSREAAAILPYLHRDESWRLVYYDAAASFWLPAGHPAAPPAVDLSDPATLPTIQRTDDGLILSAFLQQVAAKRLLKVALEKTLIFGARERLLLNQLGRLQLELRDYSGAEVSFRRLLALEENAPALNELAFLAYQRGDTESARQLLRRALELDPENEEYEQNYGRLGER